jgi:hypothetical protein
MLKTTETQTNGHVEQIKGKETVRIMEVKPSQAQKWLEGNTDNRKFREDRALAYARIIEAGDWELTGDAIVFDDQGVLINGQHRLTAIVVSGIPARLIVLRGVPTKTQEVMDTGLGRNLADQLHRRGLSPGQSTVLSGALYWTHQIAYAERTGNVHYSTPAERPSLRQLLALYDKNQEMTDLIKPVYRLRNGTKVRPGPGVAILHRLRKIDAEEADLFFERWGTGVDLKRDDPILRLREWTIEDARTAGVRGRAPAYRMVAMTFKAWNLWRDGLTTSKLGWTFSPTKKEPWPVPR